MQRSSKPSNVGANPTVPANFLGINMSTFEVKVYQIQVEPHPNAERLELARIGDYRCVVGKDLYKDGDLVAYIPEAAILPEEVAKFLELEGKLAGSAKNRVKAIKLRGILSQGVTYPARANWKLGDDVTQELGITKYEPPVPTHLAGEVKGSPYKFNFDVENIKKFPNTFKDGEEVIFTEKIHGSCMITCLVPEANRDSEMIDGKLIVISKGLANQQLFFKDNERNQGNAYVKCAKQNEIATALERFFYSPYGPENSKDIPLWVLGELYGMQDLKYGVEGGKLQFRVFGIKYGDRWIDWDKVKLIATMCSLETVPVLYKGPFSKQILEEYTKGKESVTGEAKHIREGIVVYPAQERYDSEVGRVFLKSISEDYLLRKGEVTEYT